MADQTNTASVLVADTNTVTAAPVRKIRIRKTKAEAAPTAEPAPEQKRDDLLKQLQEAKDKVAAAKEDAERRERDAALSARNPAYVVGSLRKATDADRAALGVHCHGWVGDIACQKCGATRVCNAQDLFQVHFCKDCKDVATKERAKEKRFAKANSPEKLQEQIAAMQAMLAKLTTATETK